MYEEYLGKGYHDKIRKMLTVDDKLLPDSIIDAQTNRCNENAYITTEKYRCLAKLLTPKKSTTIQRRALLPCGVLCI